MKVLFLGAGASMPACYPSAADLLRGMESEIEETPFPQARKAWETFLGFRKGASEPWASILANPNPEVVLSALDLVNKSFVAEREQIRREVREAEDDQSQREALEQYSERPVQGYYDARKARVAFLRAIDHYLAVKNFRDSESREHRQYLHPLLENLERGDAVVTTNWDPLVERTLLEQGQWTPFDGYGIEFDLQRAWPEHDPPPLPEWAPRQSAIPVLKLHGSFGWHRESPTIDPSPLYLQYAGFLQTLPLERDEETVYLRDPNEPQPPGTFHQLQISYPSYLKPAPSNELQKVWQLAQEAIQKAKTVEVVGFSLPAADVAIRTLLMPLASEPHQVVIRDPNPDTRERWARFLDGEVEFGDPVGGGEQC